MSSSGRAKLSPELQELYAPRLPMDQLPDKYRVTKSNPEPPLVYFAIPVDSTHLCQYAEEHNLTKYLPQFPDIVSFSTLLWAKEHLSKHISYQLELNWPYKPGSDSDLILSLYDNYSMKEKELVDEDEEDVINMMQEALGFDKSVRPRWYFDFHDPWRPGFD